ncbi:MAG: DNA repair protein RecO [Clostridia bacterium]|nr:DNA repair protein RecO [Clostridia bacterium]
MPSFTTPAIVIRRADYADYDRMITLFSPELGRVEAIARGCRRPKSPLVNAVEPFTSGEFQLYSHRERNSLEQCQISDSYYELRADYDRLRHGVYWLKLLDTAILPDTPAPELFITTLRALAHLNYGELPPELVTFAFESHFMRLMGLSPRMDACVRCGRAIDGEARFDADLGGAVCLDCQPALSSGPHGHTAGSPFASDAPLVSNGARRILMKLPRTQFDKFQLLRDRPEWPEAARLMRSYVNLRMRMDRFAPPLFVAANSQ